MFSRQKKVMYGIRRISSLIVSIFFFKINEVSFITIVLLEQGCRKCAKYGSSSHTWRISGSPGSPGSLGTSDSSGSITKSGYDVKYVKHAGINEVFCIRLFIRVPTA